MLLRLSLMTLVVAAIWPLFAIPAEAASRTCVRLKSELNQLGTYRASRRVERAQRKQLKSLNRQMRRYRCSNERRFFLREAHPSCRALRQRRDRASRNYLALKSSRASARQIANSKARLRRELRRKGCTGRSKARKRRKEKQLDALFSKKTRKTKPAKPTIKTIATAGPKAGRIMCVRACDGYYFPVNFSAVTGATSAEDACNNFCPGHTMAIYEQKQADGDGTSMVAAGTGAPYTNLPNAFAFRQKFDPACSCKFKPVTAAAPITPAEKVMREKLNARQTLARIAVPVWRVDPNEDPETQANQRSGLTLEEIRKANRPAPVKRREMRSIRIIGDAYFPGQ